jgi:sucrose-6-phosphate hydrolase SacC (GH32 family)
MVRTGKKATGTEILYNVKSKTLSCLGASAVVEPIDGKLKLEILLDRSSIEIFANDGKTVMSSCFSPEDGAEDLILYTNGGELLVNKMEIYPLKSIWEPKEK